MPGRLPRLPGVVAVVDTADQGYVMAPTIIVPRIITAAMVSGVDQVRAFQFVLPFRIKVGKIIVHLTTGGGAGKLYAVGIYDVDKNILFQAQEKDANATGGFIHTVTTTTLEPGVYYWAQTADTTSVIFRVADTSGGFDGLFDKFTTKAVGTATAASSPGILNSALGTITTANYTPALGVLIS